MPTLIVVSGAKRAVEPIVKFLDSVSVGADDIERLQKHTAKVAWGSPYGLTPYVNARGRKIYLYRKGQKCRWYDRHARQVGPEQRNVAPALSWAAVNGFFDPALQALHAAAKAQGEFGGGT